jgi:hypothetical protein
MDTGGNTALDPSRQSDQLSAGGVPREQGPAILTAHPHQQPLETAAQTTLPKPTLS